MPNTDPDLSPRKIIDPDGTLPDVKFVRDPDEEMQAIVAYGSERYLVVHGETVVGEAEIAKKPDGHKFDSVGIKSEHLRDDDGKKNGYGLATYLRAIEEAHAEGKPFRTDTAALTSPAVRVWRKFINKGIAHEIIPFKLTRRQEPEDRDLYQGGAVIWPPSRQ